MNSKKNSIWVWELTKVIEAGNDATGPLILIKFSLCLVSATTSAYIGASFIFQTEISQSQAINCAANGILVMIYSWRVLAMCSNAQDLIDAMKSSRYILLKATNLYLDKADFNPKVEYKMELLFKRLSNPNPLCPANVFNLNKSTILSSSAAIVTYLIILMQFKISGF